MSKRREPLCPFCGAYTPRSCDLREEMGDECAWIEMGNWNEPEEEDEEEEPEELWECKP